MKLKPTAALVILLLLVGINGTFLVWKARTPRRVLPRETPEAREVAVVERDLVNQAALRRSSSIPLIGELTLPGQADRLLLNPEQVRLIKQLDDVVREGVALDMESDARTTAKAAATPWASLAAAKQRRVAAILDARRMVARGILTERQAASLDQRLWKGRGLPSLYMDDAARYVGLNEDQKAKLERIKNDYEESASLLMAATGKLAPRGGDDPESKAIDQAVKKHFETQEALNREQNASIEAVLTPAQREKWRRAVGQTVEALQPPPGPGPAERADAVGPDGPPSPLFRALRDRAVELELTREQKALVDSLEKVTAEALAWLAFKNARIDHGSGGEPQAFLPSDPPSEFVKHAELVALNGILTKQQANKLHETLPPR